jgi:hypothetical protein
MSEAEALKALRSFEERLSVGKPLAISEVALLKALAVEGPSPRARALAAAILPWLKADTVLEALLKASRDEDSAVRQQAVEGLNAAARRLEVEGRGQVIARGIELLDDTSAVTACAAGNLVARLAPEQAADEMSRRKVSAPSGVWACWRRVVPLPGREEAIPPPPPEPPRASGGGRPVGPPSTTAPAAPTPADLRGGPLMIVTATAVGFGAGGSLMNVILPSRDTLTYRRARTVRSREEPALGSGFLVGAAGGAALGLGAWALESYKPMSFNGAAGATLGATFGTVAGIGASLGTASGDQLSATYSLVGALAGVGVGAAVGYLAEPTLGDLGFASAAAGQGLILGTLVTFAATPVGFLTVGNAPRSDFGFGVGLLSGGVFGVGALALAPVVELNPKRVMFATGVGMATAGLGLSIGYLSVPVTVDVRQRIAAGIGAGALLIGTTLAWVLIPDSWTDAVSADGSAINVDDGEVRLGVPVPAVTPDGAYVRVLGGTF